LERQRIEEARAERDMQHQLMMTLINHLNNKYFFSSSNSPRCCFVN
jgi:hypothetical protein